MAHTFSICKSGLELLNTLSVTSPIRCNNNEIGRLSIFFQPLLGHQILLPLRVVVFL